MLPNKALPLPPSNEAQILGRLWPQTRRLGTLGGGWVRLNAWSVRRRTRNGAAIHLKRVPVLLDSAMGSCSDSSTGAWIMHEEANRMAFLGVLVMLAGFVGGIYQVIQSNRAFKRSMGPQAQADGAAEYARICRENPGAPEAQISEAEFVSSYLKKQPSYLKHGLLAILFLGVLNVVGCFMVVGGQDW